MKMQEKRKQKIQWMLESFMPVFSQHGMDKTSIKMLADSVDRNVALLYQYFKDKDDMIAQCTEYYHSKLQVELVDILCVYVEDPDKMAAEALAYIDEHMDTCRFLIQVIVHPTYSSYINKTSQLVNQNLEDLALQLSQTYILDSSKSLGISQTINSLVNNYILRPSKELFMLQFNVFMRNLEKR